MAATFAWCSLSICENETNVVVVVVVVDGDDAGDDDGVAKDDVIDVELLDVVGEESEEDIFCFVFLSCDF